MTFDINGRSISRGFAVVGISLAVGAGAFFGGQSTRMDDTAIASQRSNAVEIAVDSAVSKADKAHSAELVDTKLAARDHEKRTVRKAIRKTRRVTRKTERKRAAKLIERARSEGYSSGNSAGYGAGHSAGRTEGYNDGEAEGYHNGEAEGYSDGLDDGACSNDPDVPLPYCA